MNFRKESCGTSAWLVPPIFQRKTRQSQYATGKTWPTLTLSTLCVPVERWPGYVQTQEIILKFFFHSKFTKCFCRDIDGYHCNYERLIFLCIPDYCGLQMKLLADIYISNKQIFNPFKSTETISSLCIGWTCHIYIFEIGI